ncbi:DUF4402 domain-containing protein [Sphingomonas swuensis]
MWRLLPLLGLAVSLSGATPAAAQCRLCSGGESLTAPGDVPTGPVALEVQTSLDFDQVVLTGPAGGTARLTPDGGRGTSGALEGLTARAMSGEVIIRGEAGRSIRVDLPGRIDLFGNSGTLSIGHIVSDLPAAPRLDGEGRLRVRFGGELSVSGDAEGQYRGDVPITVEYL